ncbi:hypothetical protein ACFYNX_26475 [Streptomyces sp. NPDC007872]|uniref:hypothetical protein n=1 Tax=Streptomyces sp. NPDC007872 TaxID=3364782 RepID=UPI00369AE6BC
MTTDEAITLCAHGALFLHLLPLLALALETAFSPNPDIKALFRGTTPGQSHPRSTYTAATLAVAALLLLAAAVLNLVGEGSILKTVLFAALAGVESGLAYAWHRPHRSDSDAADAEVASDTAEADTDPKDTPHR